MEMHPTKPSVVAVGGGTTSSRTRSTRTTSTNPGTAGSIASRTTYFWGTLLPVGPGTVQIY